MRNKIIYTFALVSLISCSNFKPYVFTDAYLNPVSTTEVNYRQINWSYSLFNQYASGLTFEFVANYTSLNFNINQIIRFFNNGVQTNFNDWDIVGTTQARGILEGVWKERLIDILFNRDFDRTTLKERFVSSLNYVFNPTNLVNFEINIYSAISYNVNIGSLFTAFVSFGFNDALFEQYITFYNSNDVILQTFALDNNISNVERNYFYNLGTIVTNVRSFNYKVQWIDVPPFKTTLHEFYIAEFNLFTQEQEIILPDDTSGNRFGFEFVAVEWWNFLGHLQNFAWWIVNKSPVAPVFEFIDEYIITWISGLIDLITGVFNI